MSGSDESAPWCKWSLYSKDSALLSNEIRRWHCDSWELQNELTVSYIMCDAGSNLFSLWVTTSQNTSHEWWDIYHWHFLHWFNEAGFEELLWEQVFRENLIFPSQHFIYIQIWLLLMPNFCKSHMIKQFSVKWTNIWTQYVSNIFIWIQSAQGGSYLSFHSVSCSCHLVKHIL